jgi:hypothetical protein
MGQQVKDNRRTSCRNTDTKSGSDTGAADDADGTSWLVVLLVVVGVVINLLIFYYVYIKPNLEERKRKLEILANYEPLSDDAGSFS